MSEYTWSIEDIQGLCSNNVSIHTLLDKQSRKGKEDNGDHADAPVCAKAGPVAKTVYIPGLRVPVRMNADASPDVDCAEKPIMAEECPLTPSKVVTTYTDPPVQMFWGPQIHVNASQMAVDIMQAVMTDSTKDAKKHKSKKTNQRKGERGRRSKKKSYNIQATDLDRPLPYYRDNLKAATERILRSIESLGVSRTDLAHLHTLREGGDHPGTGNSPRIIPEKLKSRAPPPTPPDADLGNLYQVNSLSTPTLPLCLPNSDPQLIAAFWEQRHHDPEAFDLKTGILKRDAVAAKVARGGSANLEPGEYNVALASREDAKSLAKWTGRKVVEFVRKEGDGEHQYGSTNKSTANTDDQRYSHGFATGLDPYVSELIEPNADSEKMYTDLHDADPNNSDHIDHTNGNKENIFPPLTLHLKTSTHTGLDCETNPKTHGQCSEPKTPFGSPPSTPHTPLSPLFPPVPRSIHLPDHVAKYISSGRTRQQNTRTVEKTEAGEKTIVKTWIEITQEVFVPNPKDATWEDVVLAVEQVRQKRHKKNGGRKDDVGVAGAKGEKERSNVRGKERAGKGNQAHVADTFDEPDYQIDSEVDDDISDDTGHQQIDLGLLGKYDSQTVLDAVINAIADTSRQSKGR